MLKSRFDTERISIRIGIIFSKVGLSPNVWTLIALLPASIGFLFLLYGEVIIAALFFIFSSFIDAIDGAVARVMGSVTDMGAFLDGIVDRYVEILLYVGLLSYLLSYAVPEFLVPHPFWISLLVFGALMPTYVRAYADHRGIVTEPEDLKRMGGVMERAERLVLLLAGMVLTIFDPAYLVYAIAATTVLANITALQRVVFAITYKKSAKD